MVERVDAYVKQLALAREVRDRYLDNIRLQLEHLLTTSEVIDGLLNRSMVKYSMVSVARKRSKSRLYLVWGHASGRYVGPYGPLWNIETKTENGTEWKQVSGKPSRHLLRRALTLDSLTEVLTIVDEVAALKQHKQVVTACLIELMLIFKPSQQTTATGKTSAHLPGWTQSTALAKSLLLRRSAVHQINVRIMKEIAKLKETEDLVDLHMLQFNMIGRRWNNNLSVSWRLPKKVETTTAGPAGPYFYRLRIGRNGNRSLERLKGKVTREDIRAGGQKRYEEEMLRSLKVLQRLAQERNEVRERLKRVAKIITRGCRHAGHHEVRSLQADIYLCKGNDET